MVDAPPSLDSVPAWTLGDRLVSLSVLLPATPDGPVLLAVPAPLAEALRHRFPGARLVVSVDGRTVTAPETEPVAPGSAGLVVVDERVAPVEVMRRLVAPGGTLAVIGDEGPHVIHPDAEHPEQIWARGWPVPLGRGPIAWTRRSAALHLSSRRGTPRLRVEGDEPALADEVVADVERITGQRARLVGVVTAGHTFLRVRTPGGDLAVKLTLVSEGRPDDPSGPVAAEVPGIVRLLPDHVARGTTHGHPWVATRWTPSGRLAGTTWWRRTSRQRDAARQVVDELAAVHTGRTAPGWATSWVDAAVIVPAPVRERLVRALEPLESGLPTSWCHGDLWPGNLLLDRRHPVVIDWDNAVRDSVQGLDRLLVAVIGPGSAPGGATGCERILELADTDAELVRGEVAGRAWLDWSPSQRRTIALAACVLYLRNRSLYDLGVEQLHRELAVLTPYLPDPDPEPEPEPQPLAVEAGTQDAQRTARGALWLGTSSIVVKTSQTVVLLTLAAVLAPEALGLVALGTLVANVSGILANLGTAQALVYWRGDVQRAARTSVTIAVVGGGALAAALWALSPWLAETFRAEDGGAAVIRGLTVVLPCIAVAAVTGELLRRELRFGRRVLPDIIASVVGAVVAVVLAVTGFGVMSLVVGQIVQGSLTMLLAWVVHPPVLPGWNAEDARGLLSYGGPLSAASLLEMVQLNLDYLFVSRVLGALALGYYSLAFRLAYLPYLMIVIVITGAAFPYLCRRKGAELGTAAERVAVATITLVLPLSLGLALFADHLVILGDKWAPAVPVVLWLAVYGLLLSVGQVVQVTLNASGRPGLSLLLRGSHLLALLVVLPVVVTHGIVAVAVAQAVVVALVASLALLLARRTISGLSLLRLAARLRAPAAGAVAMTATVVALRALHPPDPGSLVDFVVAGLLAVATYAATLWALDRAGLREAATLLEEARMKPAVRAAGRLARPVSAATRALRDDSSWLTVVGWHRFGPVPDGLTTTMDAFRRQLDVLDEWGARILPLSEAVTRLEAGTLPARAVVLTFDDGYASVVEQAWPILHDRGLPATLYMVSGYLDAGLRLPWDEADPDAELVRLMTRGQLEEAAQSGLDIGSHTVSHPWLPRQDPERLGRELTDSRAALEDLLHRPIDSVAYPAGGWNAEVRDAAALAGYRTGITVDRGINTTEVDGLALRRAFVPEDARDLGLILDGAYTWLRPVDAWRGRHGRGQLA